ncbi:histidine kinase [Borreliella lusitaniae]|uniref:histidine kinase n=1 Tax=Borreliella lusitaniae TaxID=100177 RepID=UPI002649D718|nr:histidine kinase [Borreliella lusitaniae]WKC85543.1 histidine kinase [Borreliella lusitaniae]
MFRKLKRSKTYIIIISITKFSEKNLLSIISNIKYLIEHKKLAYKIHWTFPIYFFEILREHEELNKWLLERFKTNADIYMPGTYSGSPHEYMLHDEIHLDLYWALKNPFKSGYKDMFQNAPIMFYIYNIEKFRKKVTELYRKLNFNYTEGIRQSKNNKNYLIFYKNNCQYLYEVQKIDSPKSNVETLIYFYEIKENYDNQELKNFLLYLKALENSFHSIKIQNLEGSKLTAELLEIPKFNSLKEQEGIINFQNKRLKDYQINEKSLREFLINKNQEEIVKNSESIATKNLEYNMEGNFTLSHDQYNIKFENGKLNKIKFKDKKVEFLNTSRTYFKVLSKKELIKEASIESSFSFSNEKILGIKQYLAFHSASKSTIDFFIDETISSFFVSIKIKWPSEVNLDKKTLKKCNPDYILEYSALEIPVFEISKGTNLKITAKYSDLDTYEKIIITKNNPKGYINGTEFLISKGNDKNSNFFISFLNVEKQIIHTINYKIEKINSKKWLILNIGGSYNTVHIKDVINYSQTLNLMILPLNNNFDNKIKLNSKIKNLIFYTNIKKYENK